MENTNSAATAQSNPLNLLTNQQIRVLELCQEGLPAAEIGRQLNITEKTVKFHKTRIYKRLGVKSNLQALLVFQTLRGPVANEALKPAQIRRKYSTVLALNHEQRKHIIALTKKITQLTEDLEVARMTILKLTKKDKAATSLPYNGLPTGMFNK